MTRVYNVILDESVPSTRISVFGPESNVESSNQGKAVAPGPITSIAGHGAILAVTTQGQADPLLDRVQATSTYVQEMKRGRLTLADAAAIARATDREFRERRQEIDSQELQLISFLAKGAREKK